MLRCTMRVVAESRIHMGCVTLSVDPTVRDGRGKQAGVSARKDAHRSTRHIGQATQASKHHGPTPTTTNRRTNAL